MLRKIKNIFDNKYMSKSEKLKIKFFKGLAIGILITIAIVLVYQLIVIPKVKSNAEKAVLTKIENQNKDYVSVIVVKDGLKQNSDISAGNIDRILMPKSKVPASYIKEEEQLKNKVVRVNLDANTILTSNLILEKDNSVTDDLRKQDYEHITLNKNLKQSNYVDIRFKKNDGTDFIVASKKQVLDTQGNMILLNITEEERQYINNATVASSLSGGNLYTTIYVDPENQPKAAVTYQLNFNIKSLIDKNPKIVKEAEQDIIKRNQAIEQPNNQETKKESSETANEMNNKDRKPEFKSK